MKTENMTENRALNAKLLLLIAKQRNKLFSMQRHFNSCEQQAKFRENNLNKLLEFSETERKHYKDYEKDYWELNKKYLEALSKIAYLREEIKGLVKENSKGRYTNINEKAKCRKYKKHNKKFYF